MAMIRPEIDMKDSGIEYVGAIPKDWDLVRLRAYFGERKNKNKDGNETNLLSLSYGRIIRKNIDKTDGLLPASFNTYNIVEKNDIIIRPTDLQNDKRSLRTGLVTEHGIITSAYIDLMPIGNVDSRFVHYLLHSYDILKVFYNMGSGVRQGLNYSEFSKLKVPMPLLSEQQAIADYLDETCSKIDEIIEEAKASIDEYKELKQSVIFEAVTKGLDKNVEMKDSCVEWIGEIPSSWQLRKLKTFTVMISKGTTPKDMSNVKTTLYCVRYLKSENIKNNHLDIVPEFYITEETHNELSRSKLNGNDILFVIAGASIGKVAIMDENLLPANTNQANAFIRIKDEFMDSIEYLWMLLQSVIVKEVINRYSVQSAQPNISMENLGNIKLPYPLLKRERDNIMNYLREKVDAIDSLIAEKESLINDLEAYKKSLIYEVVTGKRRVV